MTTFEEYQALATQVSLSLRNNRDRIDFPVMGLQGDAGRIGSLLAAASASGAFVLTEEQKRELQDRLADMLWYIALLCRETGTSMQAVAEHSTAQLQARLKELDPDQR